jgi:hypothetical protein
MSGQSQQADAEESCSGYNGPYFEPQIGQRYLVSGAYVRDADHGWNELHAVTAEPGPEGLPVPHVRLPVVAIVVLRLGHYLPSNLTEGQQFCVNVHISIAVGDCPENLRELSGSNTLSVYDHIGSRDGACHSSRIGRVVGAGLMGC